MARKIDITDEKLKDLLDLVELYELEEREDLLEALFPGDVEQILRLYINHRKSKKKKTLLH